MLLSLKTSNKAIAQTERYYGGDGQGYTMSATMMNQVLPVEWTSFKGEFEQSAVRLIWTTATEINNDYFAIQRSNNGLDFSTVGKVAGSGTSDSQIDYLYIDQNPMPGINYYRLKQVDFDGRADYSEIVTVDAFFKSTSTFNMYPNPALDVLNVFLPIKGDYEIGIVDFMGRLMLCKKIEGGLEHKLDIRFCTPGIYVVRTSGENVNMVSKLIVK